jgi:hypothetical protein
MMPALSAVTGDQFALRATLSTISGGMPTASRMAAKPLLSGAGEIAARKLLGPITASSRSIHSKVPSSRAIP